MAVRGNVEVHRRMDGVVGKDVKGRLGKGGDGGTGDATGAVLGLPRLGEQGRRHGDSAAAAGCFRSSSVPYTTNAAHGKVDRVGEGACWTNPLRRHGL